MLRTLKPDIVAPGDNIMAQGYGPDPAKTSAEFGVNSGTSVRSSPGPMVLWWWPPLFAPLLSLTVVLSPFEHSLPHRWWLGLEH